MKEILLPVPQTMIHRELVGMRVGMGGGVVRDLNDA